VAAQVSEPCSITLRTHVE